MRILILTWGSRGDFQPFLALGRALQAAGHAVTVGGLAYGEPWVTAAGLDFLPAGPEDYDPATIVSGMTQMYQMSNPMQSARHLVTHYVAPSIIPTYEALARSDVDPDLIVSHHVQIAGPLFGQKLGKPVVTACFVPHTIPSRRTPPMYMPNLGTTGNRMAWWLTERVMEQMYDRPLNQARRQLGFPPVRNAFLDGGYSKLLHLVPISPHVFPPQPDWPPHYHVTGYWFYDQASRYEPDPALEAFLAAGPPPVLISFGSMPADDTVEIDRILVGAAGAAGLRAVIQAGWAGLAEGAVELPETVFAAGDLPHDWLMPRVSAVVHHGGAGTTAAVLRAGLPSVVVPHLADQPAWAATLRQLGVSPPAIPRARLAVPALAEALRAVTGDPAMRAKAAALGAAIRAEDGLGAAVGLIEGVADRSATTFF